MGTVVKNDALQLQQEQLGPYGTNGYVLTCLRTGESMVIDAPGEPERIVELLSGMKPEYLVLTHNHLDHTGALAELRSLLDVPLAVHIQDAKDLDVTPDILLKGGELLELGNLRIEVMHTPGHTPGGICLYTPEFLLAGDTLFPGGPGKTWSPEGFRQLLDSITGKLFALPDATTVWPGHGEGCTIAQSKKEYEVFMESQHPDDLFGDVLWASA